MNNTTPALEPEIEKILAGIMQDVSKFNTEQYAKFLLFLTSLMPKD